MFAQAILVNRLRKSGSPRLTIFADAGCATGSFKRQSETANLVGRSLRVVPVDLGTGRFHPKAIFLAGPDGASLAIGSGNLGHGGWSGNREIWTYFDTSGESGAAIAAFRDYLEEVCVLSRASDIVRSTVLEPFRTEKWATELPAPGGLLALPADTPLMDRLLSLLEAAPTSFDMFAPYFDAEGYAVAELARRLNVPMRVLIQDGKAGLSAPAAATLPGYAKIHSIRPSADPQFIHAKFYAARYPDHVVMVAGSANCSRAALLSRRDGNAELMAISRMSQAEYADLLAGIAISDDPPELPATAPNDDWDAIESVPVRVLAASFEGGVLSLRCAFGGGAMPDQVNVILEGFQFVALRRESGDYAIEATAPGSRVWVEIDTPAGTFRSSPMWIDHEAELRVGRPELDVTARLASGEGPISSDGLIDLFTLVVEHYNSPIPWSGGERKKTEPVVEYNLADVFSDGFGRRSYVPVPGTAGYFSIDEWALMMDYFRTGSSIRNAPKGPNDPEDPEGNTDDSPPQQDPPSPIKPLEATQAQKLSKLIDRAVASLSSMKWLESRPPARLGADIRTGALLIALARRRPGMDKSKLDAASARAFQALFVGTDGNRPLLDQYVENHPEAPELMRSSELTAAMTSWIADLVNKPEAGPAFEFAATRVAAAHPWLALGGEEVEDALQRLSLHGDDLEAALSDFWVSWVRGGAAVDALMQSLSDPARLISGVTRPTVSRGELIWAGMQFAIAQADYERKGKAEVMLLREARIAKYKGTMTIPILDILDRLGLSDQVVETLRRILTPAPGKARLAA